MTQPFAKTQMTDECSSGVHLQLGELRTRRLAMQTQTDGEEQLQEQNTFSDEPSNLKALNIYLNLS